MSAVTLQALARLSSAPSVALASLSGDHLGCAPCVARGLVQFSSDYGLALDKAHGYGVTLAG